MSVRQPSAVSWLAAIGEEPMAPGEGERRPRAEGALPTSCSFPGETGAPLPCLDRREVKGMALQSERTDRWPTILWIAWRAGEVDRQEPLCLAHRAHIFEHYPSAHGLKRRGDR